MKNRFVIYIIFGLILMGLLKMRSSSNQLGTTFPFKSYQNLDLIAHAGGGLEIGMYTNSLEALNKSYENGFTLIEVDFKPTTSNELILIHDFGPTYEKYFSESPLRSFMSNFRPRAVDNSKAFKSTPTHVDITPMDIHDLINWMETRPDVRIITDIKSDNLKHLKTIKQAAGPISDKFIPQIYETKNYQTVLNMGFSDLIYTNYRTRLNHSELLKFISTEKIFALTIPLEHGTTKFLDQTKALGIPVYGHRFSDTTPWDIVNTPEGANRLQKLGFQGVYTDYLYPQKDVVELGQH